MAKTTSQIIAENKIKRAEEAAIGASLSKIHQQQMAGVAEKAAARTLAVLNKAISGTSDSAKKSELSRAAQMVTEEYKKASSQNKTGPKTATDMQKKKEDRIEEKSQVDSLQIKKDRAEKALKDFDENKEIDWTDTNQRKQYDAERKRLQEEVDRAGAEIDARADAATHEANMAEISTMDDEDLRHLEQYIESRDARRSVFGNPISWFQNYNTETDSKNVLLEKYGEDRLAELAETYGRQLHEEQAEKIEEDTKTSVDQNWISAAIHNIVGIPARAMGGIEALAGRMYEKADRTGQYRTLEEYTPGDMLSLYGNTVSGTTAQNIAGEDGNTGRQILSIGYQGVMSLVDSIARAFFGGGSAGGAALAATSSFSQTVSEATKQGASPQQAVALGVATAGMEYVSEKIPMDEVFKLAKAGDTKVLAQAFKQAGVEITTEELSLFGSMAAEAAILREKSSYKQQIGDLVAGGASYEDAKAQANKAVWEEVKQTAYVSGFAGIFSGGGSAIVGNLTTNNAPEVTEEVQQEQLVQTPPEAPVVEPVQQAGPSTEQLLEGVQDMTPPPAPLTEEQQHFDNAAAIANGVQPAQQPTVDAAPVTEAEAYHDEFEDWGNDPNREGVENPLADRSYSEVGKRNVKAYMYENPAVKPFYQEQAAWLLSELADSTKGERTYNEQLHYESGGEQGWSGTKRHTSDSIAELLDQDGMTYDQIERGLNAIVNDHGQENNAVSKRIEFVINDRLMNGYTDFHTGEKVPGNAEYLNLLRNQQSASDVDTAEAVQMDASNIQNQSTDGGRVKGTGAAERNFSGKEEYNNLLYDGNVQRDRPTDVRPMEVPKRDSDGRRVTEFAANAYAAEVTPDHMASEIESLIQDKELSFDTRSNQESLYNAAEAIGEAGEEETRLRISRNASENRIQDGDIEQGLLLYAKYAADPEMQDQASSLLVDMGKLANMSGRNLQMFSLLRRMTPEGRVMTVQKNVARYVQDINKGRSARQQIDSARIIDKDLEQQLRTAATDEERQKIENAIYKDVASQIKPTLGEAWDAWRNLAMLGNAKTHERNFISTGTWKPFAAVKRDISAVLQKVFLKQEQRTASILGPSKKDIDLLAWAKADAKDQDIQERMGFSGTTGNEARNAIEENRQMLPGFLDKLAKGNRTLMEKEDMIWKRSEYAPALAGFMKARGYTADQIHNGEVPNGILEDARQYAIKEAQKATFNDSNGFSDWVTSTFKPKHGRVVDPILNVLKKGSVPFLRTPANVVVRAMEYNPLALGKTLLTAKRDIDSGKKSAADVVNDISAGLTGTAAMGIGAMLAAGMVPGVKLHGKVDDEDELREGIKSYSIQIGDKCYSVAWLAPGMIPLFTGANIYNMWTAQADEANADVDGWDLVESLKGVAVDAIDPILELSMLSSLNDIIDNVAYEEDGGDKLMAFFLNAATSYMFQGLPTIFGQIEQSTEETKSSTYINTDNKTEATVKRALSSASQRIPGLDLYQTEKLNEWGEPVKNEGSSLERAMAAMFSPSSVSEVKDDAITKEITRLNRVQTENVSPPSFSKIVSYTDIHGNIHANIRLTEEQYQTMARTQGQTSKRLIAEMLLTDDYKVMTDEQKAKAITQAYAYARETAEKATFQDHEGYSANWMNDAAEGEPKDTAAYIMRRITNSDINSAMTSLDSAWDKNHDQAIVDRWMRELDTAYNAYSNMSKDMKSDVREFATSTTAKYLEARDNGVSHEDFLTVAEGINSVKGTGKYNAETGKNAVRDIDRRGVIANANISTAAKDKLMMAYMEDYEHGVEGTETSELKYQYIRQELGLSPQDYIKAYEVDLAGGKWRDIRSGIMKTLGCDYGTANKLLLIFEGRYKQQLIDWYTS